MLKKILVSLFILYPVLQTVQANEKPLSRLKNNCLSQTEDIPGLRMIEIAPGKFQMGSAGEGENFDESPIHKVTISHKFSISATEITNAQYEMFDPEHKKLRGKKGFSKEDDEAVVFVSYYDALSFCEWLSKKTGKKYRLPTEAEWEYACRAGSNTAFSTGDDFPKEYYKQQKLNRDPKSVSLKVAQFPANKWGLYDMHGNVEEWCYDWYGAYEKQEQIDPVGRELGEFKVTRGGSHNTLVKYLRSANRMAMIPEDKNWLVGFRVVEGNLPATKPLPATFSAIKINQQKFKWPAPANRAVFMEPVYYVFPSDTVSNPKVPFYPHNHCPAITWCDNGDLMAIWFSTISEAGREMTILGSRLKPKAKEWEKPNEFLRIPDRNLTGSSLFNDGKGTLYHMNGVEASGGWTNLAIVRRMSKDNGQTWSKLDFADAEHTERNQVIAGMFKTKEGWLVQACDASPKHTGGTAVHISKDNGKTWDNPYKSPETPVFETGNQGGLIAGIHAGVVQLKNGDLMALGRNDNVKDLKSGILRMPMSVSKNMGKSWVYSASEFPTIYSGQRLVLLRLNEGPLLLVSFTHHPNEKENIGMMFKNSKGEEFKGYGMFAAISYDEGKTWPVKKLITDGIKRNLNGGGWTGQFEMDETHAEPKGYLAATQSPDNIIHLISSKIHYRFNLKWLEK